MKCNKCGMIYNGNDDFCPRCGNKLGSDSKLKQMLIREFRLKGNVNINLMQIIFYALTNISLVLLAVNLIVSHEFMWSLCVINAFSIFYYITKCFVNTYQYNKNLVKLYLFSVVLIILMQYFTFKGNWAYSYLLPILAIMVSIYSFIVLFTRISFFVIFKFLAINTLITTTIFILLFTGYTCQNDFAKSLIIISFVLNLLVVFNGIYCFWKFFRR